MRHAARQLTTALLSFVFLTSQSFAQSSYLTNEKLNFSRASEYISGNSPGTVLMKINLWGAVHQPGIHHVPVNTDLMTLISYAGGPSDKAQLDEVTIKREIGNTRKLIKIDVDELVSGVSHHQVNLSPNDIIVIPQDEPWVDRDTFLFVSVLSMIASTVLAITYIDRRN